MSSGSARRSAAVLTLLCSRATYSASQCFVIRPVSTLQRQFASKSTPSDAHPTYQEYLEKKQRRDKEAKQKNEDSRNVRPPTGDLAADSIFGDAPESSDPGSTKASKFDPAIRDPNNMAMTLDPRPKARKRWERRMIIQTIRRRGRLSPAQIIKRTERELLCKSAFIKTSVKKLAPLARQITGKSLDDALIQMRFSLKKAAIDVRKHLVYARDTAVVNRGMGIQDAISRKATPVEIESKVGKKIKIKNPKDMYIAQAWVGRGTYGTGFDHRARGRVHRLRLPWTSQHPLSNVILSLANILSQAYLSF
ncbi:MAG: 54S ribosomal protein L22, mitochondrial [Vezdaea aestivalis]|nr:MAG: 54S ribosomal protein L22, mitochondrial [Vezdaea aestivalis]